MSQLGFAEGCANLQRDVIIALSKQPYQEHNKSHKFLLDNLRHLLASYLSPQTIQILNIHQSFMQSRTPNKQKQISSKNEISDLIFEKDVAEAVGFTYGKYPDDDIKEAGMLGILSALYFFEKIQKIYDQEEHIFIHESKTSNIDNETNLFFRSQNIFMNNLMKMS